MAFNSFRHAHQVWIGNVQPVGLLVSAVVLEEAQAAIDLNPVGLHRDFLELMPRDKRDDVIPELPSFRKFAERILDWPAQFWAPPPESTKAFLESDREELSPDAVLLDSSGKVVLLIAEVPKGISFDDPPKERLHAWNASPHARFERLLRDTNNPVGVLATPEAIRLVYAPQRESTAYATFWVDQMATVQGRVLLGALHMLLGKDRLYIGSDSERLLGILRRSRDYQNDVSTALSGQVLEALFELLHGFQAADDYRGGGLLSAVLNENPTSVYDGLLTVLMRLVFLLYAEDRGLMPRETIYAEHYGVSGPNGLFNQLERDADEFPNDMPRRYGAWARLLSLFRLVWNGGRHGDFHIPARHGYLFDPNRYPFLSAVDARGHVPHVSDGTVINVLRKLLILNGERLSYRALDVEQIGSVYEAMMGFELHVADGPSRAIRTGGKTSAPVTINLERLLGKAGDGRAKWLKAETGLKLSGEPAKLLKSARTADDLETALKNRIHMGATPERVRKGAMILQPSLERRRTGSHYTPRSLTRPIVEDTLAPIFKGLGDDPTPDQILSLKVCDPAMGSGAFLVEASRQIGEKLVEAWKRRGEHPNRPDGEDDGLYAQRLVAQRCVYGVDKNHMAVDLAKLSLWLSTLARDHAFTFLDHTLRHGDSLVGLSPRQIASLNLEEGQPLLFVDAEMRRRLAFATKARKEILDAGEDQPYDNLLQRLSRADENLALVRMLGDAVCATYLLNEKPAPRAAAFRALADRVNEYLAHGDVSAGLAIESQVQRMRRADHKPVIPFHWEIEFPEVFQADIAIREPSGFDAIVGNPPFAGKNTLAAGTPKTYPKYLQSIHRESHGNADLVAHFFRRGFALLKDDGCFGLIATNTIGQGDTRFTGLRWIRKNGGTIYRATKRYVWPGEATVVVSVVHVRKGTYDGPLILNDREVPVITAYLFHSGPDENPHMMASNKDKSFQGSVVLGMGFTFDDKDKKQVAWPIEKKNELITADPKNIERIFPYLGGKEINEDTRHQHRRYVINFEDFPLERADLNPCWETATVEARKSYIATGRVPLDYPGKVANDWPELLDLVRERVKPERDKLRGSPDADRRRNFWWLWGRYTPALFRTIRPFTTIFACSRVSPMLSIASIPTALVPADSVVAFASQSFAFFAVIQSSVHEIWVRMMTSTLEDRLRYAPSDCFETFPFPRGYESNEKLESVGREYYEFRAELMRKIGKGLTKTYNSFHDRCQQSADFKKLRKLHDDLDNAVLSAYGWKELHAIADFELEHGAASGIDIEDSPSASGKKHNKKYRRRWPESIRDDILFRLLLLNAEYAAEAPVFKNAEVEPDEEDEPSDDDEFDEESEDEE